MHCANNGVNLTNSFTNKITFLENFNIMLINNKRFELFTRIHAASVKTVTSEIINCLHELSVTYQYPCNYSNCSVIQIIKIIKITKFYN